MGSYVPQIRRVGVIGAGPTAVAFAKFLLAEKAFDKIDIWEQRNCVGGVWNLSERTRSQRIPLPQTNPRYGQRSSGKSANAGPSGDSLEFESPMYDYLETNIPKQLMAFSEKPFLDNDPLFPSHQRVLEYLKEHAKEVEHLVKFEQQVENVEREADSWLMTVRDLKTNAVEVHEYDGIVVANGHYTVPYVPAMDGLEDWSQAYSGAVIHSKAYRRPEDYTNKKVLVVGNKASGMDIAFQVSQEARHPVLLSARSPSAFGHAAPPAWRQDVEEVVEFLPPASHNRAVRYKNGTVEEDIDVVIFCTGYFYSFPFLSSLQPPIVTDGLRIRDVYQDLFHIDHPSMVFPVINTMVIPFPLAENQAAVVARVWSGRLGLPSEEKMREWEADRIRVNGPGKYFHLRKFPADIAQMNQLYDWALSADLRPGLENDGQGKLGRRRGKEMVWLRSQFAVIRAAFAAKGKQRQQIKNYEQLGFNFETWLQSASEEDKKMFEQALC